MGVFRRGEDSSHGYYAQQSLNRCTFGFIWEGSPSTLAVSFTGHLMQACLVPEGI